VRSIKPDMRNNVIDMLLKHEGMRETIVHILLTMKRANSGSPFCALRGHESSILLVIAGFAGAIGWPLQNLKEAIETLEEIIERFNVDGWDDMDDNGSDGGVDDEMAGGDY